MEGKGRLPAGKTYDRPVIQLDIPATVITAAGGKIDPAWKLDGVDLLPYLSGRNTGKPHEALYWRFGEQWAIRQGDWKLVVSRIDGEEPRLFNLAEDVGEAKDLAARSPEKVKELTAAWKAWNAEQKDPLWGPPAARKRARRAGG